MKKYIIILTALLSIVSCNKKDNCKETQMATKQFDSEYGCSDSKHTLKIDLVNNVTIIRDKTTYDSEVSGGCHPVVDFTVYDLVIGKQSTEFLNDTITYDLRNACPDNTLTLTVNIIQSSVAEKDTVVYHALIPKIEDQGNLTVSLILKQQ
jgi:hypothetical protein